MQIERIQGNGYNAKGFHLGEKKTRKGLRRPIEALTLETVELSHSPVTHDFSWLAQYIKDLPDEVVKERLKHHRDSFESIDDALVDSLIIEEL